ncbi:iron-containing redox enzyme family protein [Hoyosella sp. G463]|uniref:Iron-containing redox enzyme family protein n=1 Tax=Lolliginicoccus lacisalsi TaxID=2742202 RepID=A0A927PKV5_9ACTN|nr:iron-containing redox enzyme family protein [Lolliginicoccus lacisalsi]MBD8506450.1 iron-containing redox enzyme family protein [Lolliginicoccus lacisalsi]
MSSRQASPVVEHQLASEQGIPGPSLPRPRGPVSAGILEALSREAAEVPNDGLRDLAGLARGCDALGEDAQLALTVCYELHYQGFANTDPAWEWHPALLGVRAALEPLFLDVLREHVHIEDPVLALEDLCAPPPSTGTVGTFMRDSGTWAQMRELFIHRSIYQLKEADPQAWAIPRLTGRPKAALVAVEFDEYGGGQHWRMHSRLFADLMDAADLDSRYLAYLDQVPAETLATVNLMSLCGLHRSRLGAHVGMFAAAEISNGPGARVMRDALERLGAREACVHFYREHIEADAVHEQLMRTDVVGELLRARPDMRDDVSFGIGASSFLEERSSARLLGSWEHGRTSLREAGEL